MLLLCIRVAEFARALGVDRVVVGRELSVAEIAAMRANTGAEVEAFVHGALCVSYRSGRPLCAPPFQTRAPLLHVQRQPVLLGQCASSIALPSR